MFTWIANKFLNLSRQPLIDDTDTTIVDAPYALPAANACINILSGVLASCPKQLIELGDDDRTPVKIVTQHPVSSLLAEPSKTWDATQFWQMYYERFTTLGNGYSLIMRDGLTPVELRPVDRSSVNWTTDRTSATIQHQLTMTGPSGLQYTRTDRDVLGLHWYGFNGLSSPSPIMFAAIRTITMMSSAIAHNQRAINTGIGTYLKEEPDAFFFLEQG